MAVQILFSLNKILNIVTDQGVLLTKLIPNSLDDLVNLGYEIVIVDLEIVENDIHQTTFTALKTGRVDIAILHLPELNAVNPSNDLIIAALSERNNAQDCLVINENFYDPQAELRLKAGAVVHVVTNIQAEQLKKLSPSIQTSVSKSTLESLTDSVNSGEIHAAIIPKFMIDFSENRDNSKIVNLHPKEMIPAPGQGTFAFVTHKENITLRKTLKTIHQKDVAEISNVERKVRQMLPSNDQQNLAVHCYKDVSGNFHAVGSYLDQETSTLKFAIHSQSTSEGLSEKIFHSLYHK